HRYVVRIWRRRLLLQLAYDGDGVVRILRRFIAGRQRLASGQSLECHLVRHILVRGNRYVRLVEELLFVAGASVLRGDAQSRLLFIRTGDSADQGARPPARTSRWSLRHVGAGPARVQRRDCWNHRLTRRYSSLAGRQRGALLVVTAALLVYARQSPTDGHHL